MPVDVSMYPQAQPPVNLLDTLGKFQAIQGAINQNKLFPLQQQQAQLANQAAQLGIDTNQQALRQKQVESANTYLGSVFASNPNATPADAIKAITAGAKAGVIPADLAATYTSQIPTDANEFKNFTGQIVAQGLSPESRGTLQFGTPQMVQTGQTQTPMTVSATQGAKQIGAPIANQITPAELASPVTVFNPQTQANETITKAQFLARTNGGGLPESMTGQLPSNNAPTSGFGSGRMRNPTAGVQSTPALGATEAASAKAANSVKMGTELTQEALKAPELKAAYANMADALKGFTPGPGSQWTKETTSFLNKFMPDVMARNGLQFDPKTIASQEEFNKLANTIALQQGAQSDMHLNIASGANPNSQMSKLGIQNVLNILQGNEDAKIIKSKAWQDWAKTHGDQSFGEFSADFNQKFDPRVMQFEHMDKAGRTQILSDMSPKDKAAFAGKLRYAQSQGWVQ